MESGTSIITSPAHLAAAIPAELMHETHNEDVPLTNEALTTLVALARAARGLYDTDQRLEDIAEHGVSFEYLRGQVELIIEATYGLQQEDNIKSAVETLIFSS